MKKTRLQKLNLRNMHNEFNKLKRGIIKCRDYIFIFLENPAIPSDNNGSRSDTGAYAFHALHSIADTAWKNGQSPMNDILSLA